VGGITAITLSSNPPNITSLCGGPITLSIPSGFTSIVWSSGPTGVSSIVATSPGEYSVRAQSSGGCQAQSDTITIVQSENPTAGLSYSQATPGVYEVVFTNTSENSASYLWDFGNNFTTTAANPTFTFNADGEYNIRLIATNACGSDTLDTVIVVIKVGINDLESAINLAIYPNPFKDQIRIETESAKAEKLELSIYNMVGKLISKESYTSAGKTIRTADLSGVANGIYFIKIQSETGSVSRKVVKN